MWMGWVGMVLNSLDVGDGQTCGANGIRCDCGADGY